MKQTLIAFLVVSLVACQGTNFGAREKGALTGGALGAGLGAIIGHETGATGAGIAIGSALGAVSGALVGNQIDAADAQANEVDHRLQTNEEIIRENQRLIDELKGSGADVYSTERGVVVNVPDVLFEFDKATLTEDARITISHITNVLRDVKGRRISVEGHTDSIGTMIYNQRLSEERARSVSSELVRKGISRRRITTQGFGESQPIASNRSTEGRARNRRVEIIIENR